MQMYISYLEKEKNVAIKINDMIKSNREKGLKTGVMCTSKNREFYDGEVIDLGNSLEEVASNLFDALIEMDKKSVDVIYSEEFPKTGVGQAIMNRLLKSAGYKVIKA